MFILAILPVIILFLIFWFTKCIKKENLKLHGKLFLFGILSCIALIILILTILDSFRNLFDQQSILYIIFNNLVLVAGLEEGFKFLSVKLGMRKNTGSYDRVDMMMFCSTAALGFAAFENFFYLLDENSIFLAVKRALLSVPAHASYGIIMGYYFSLALAAKASENRPEYIKNIRNAILIPAVIHGFADMFIDLGEINELLIFVSIAIIIASYVYSVKLIKRAKSEIVTEDLNDRETESDI
jgi:RsiW-degrading membrane proteinase PrsW (M82 family)